jgi:hypothetical protein
LPGNIVGLDMIAKDAVVLGYLRKRLSRRELRDLVQITTPAPEDAMSCKDANRICPLLILGP